MFQFFLSSSNIQVLICLFIFFQLYSVVGPDIIIIIIIIESFSYQR